MKKSPMLVALVTTLFVVATAPTSLAADGKEVSIQGEGKCAKCELKKTDSCQNVIEVTKDGKKETYFLVQNDVSKKFHSNLCQATAKVKATGTVKEVDGKKEMTVSKIELDK